MANRKKTQAERAASDVMSGRSGKKHSIAKKNEKAARNTGSGVRKESVFPTRFITSALCLGLFTLFLVIALGADGALLKVLENIILGLFGRNGFIVSIPVLLYIFIIQAFSGKRPVIMRSVCLIVFIFLCGSIAHLSLGYDSTVKGLQTIITLYQGGVSGTAGGVLCGGFALLSQWLCGTLLSYIIFIIGAIFTLLGGMQITIPSIVRAIQNRPRATWENSEMKERPEPASIVVNHIANKRIAYEENRRNKLLAEEEEIISEIPPKKKNTTIGKAADMMRQIASDVEEPVAVAGVPVICNEQEDIVVPADHSLTVQKDPIASDISSEVSTGDIPDTMPELQTAQAQKIPQQVVKPRKITAKEADMSEAQVAAEIAQNEGKNKPQYCFPPVDLLRFPRDGVADGTSEMRENSRRLNETLLSFKIEAHIINVTRGPSVTRYEVELEKGVKLSKLTSAADDIALSLGASGVRIAAVPGKISVVGIEVPNIAVTTVSLREVIDSTEFTKAKSKSSFAVGKDIGGNCIIGNIAKLPHMLIAGTTGSGKSVCMNSIIISLLYKASPDDVKLIMVDPKMVELGIYNSIPHLLIPVVTDPKKAAGSLQWAVTEMMRRYRAMSDAGVRDLESYNDIVLANEEGSTLPQIVVIIDELADLMLVAAKEVEESICRIAQMGRAAGIHLIIATQRPSADVITGLMKANIPSRIAFAVASAMESRIILDTQGAEKLVGKGDMLYAPIGCGKPKRIQGCFVSDSEVEAVANYVKDNFATTYDQQVMEEIEKKAAQTGTKASAGADTEPTSEEISGDEMLPAAVDVILETGQASVSMLQRRLKLGYARAARIVDEMEERGIVGPFQGSKPREILITKDTWTRMQSGQPVQMNFESIGENNFDTEDDE